MIKTFQWSWVLVWAIAFAPQTWGQDRQARLNELAREAAGFQKQAKERTDEIERILQEHPNDNLVRPSIQAAPSTPAPVEKEPVDKLAEVLKLRQTLKDPSLADLPAKLAYSHPDHGSDTIAIDTGVALNLFKAFNVSHEIRQTTKLDLFAEYHKSNSTTSPADTFLGGVQFKRNLGRFDNWGNWLGGDASFKRDDLISGRGLFAEIFYYPYHDALGISRAQTLGPIEYSINPNVGLQLETGNGASVKFTSGDRISAKAALNLTLAFPVPNEGDRRLEWSNTINLWHHLSTTGGFDRYDRDQQFFQSSVNLYLDQAKQVALGLDYTSGDNLTSNQFDVHTWALSFKAKLGK
jgi:hypothetical protein